MGKQLDSFKTSLEDFAGKYKQEIKKNPEFRGHFQQMCARIGVDPLACKLTDSHMIITWQNMYAAKIILDFYLFKRKFKSQK